jgi:hypothetical protein
VGIVALTAVRHAGDRLDTLLCRQRSASAPRMPGQVDMASDRHEARIASCCAWLICAAPGSVAAARIAIAASSRVP